MTGAAVDGLLGVGAEFDCIAVGATLDCKAAGPGAAVAIAGRGTTCPDVTGAFWGFDSHGSSPCEGSLRGMN